MATEKVHFKGHVHLFSLINWVVTWLLHLLVLSRYALSILYILDTEMNQKDCDLKERKLLWCKVKVKASIWIKHNDGFKTEREQLGSFTEEEALNASLKDRLYKVMGNWEVTCRWLSGRGYILNRGTCKNTSLELERASTHSEQQGNINYVGALKSSFQNSLDPLGLSFN